MNTIDSFGREPPTLPRQVASPGRSADRDSRRDKQQDNDPEVPRATDTPKPDDAEPPRWLHPRHVVNLTV